MKLSKVLLKTNAAVLLRSTLRHCDRSGSGSYSSFGSEIFAFRQKFVGLYDRKKVGEVVNIA
jgi:hypothetical protein